MRYALLFLVLFISGNSIALTKENKPKTTIDPSITDIAKDSLNSIKRVMMVSSRSNYRRKDTLTKEKDTIIKKDSIPFEQSYKIEQLTRVPEASIYETLKNINGVSLQINSNISGAGGVYFNGMPGKYNLVLIDGFPIVEGISYAYGLYSLPNSFLKEVQISKNSVETINGFKPIGGIINLVTKNVADAPKFTGGISASSIAEYNVDLATKYLLSERITGNFSANGLYFDNKLDENNDGFTDVPLIKRYTMFNKLNFQGKTNSKVSVRYLYEERFGGELNWDKDSHLGSNQVYGEYIETSQFAVTGDFKIPLSRRKIDENKDTSYVSEDIDIGVSFSRHVQEGYYGDDPYNASQSVRFLNLSKGFNLDNHTLVAGITDQYTYYDDGNGSTEDDSLNNEPRNFFLTSAFSELTLNMLPHDDESDIFIKANLTTLFYGQSNYSNDYTPTFAPGLSLKYIFNNLTTLEVSGGRGFRVVDMFNLDYPQYTVTSREVVFSQDIEPEQSWNTDVDVTHEFHFEDKGILKLYGSVFYNRYENQILPDYNTNANQVIYDNANGHGINSGSSISLDYDSKKRVSVNFGVTFRRAYTDENGQKNDIVNVPQLSSVYGITFNVNEQTKVNISGQVYGPMKMVTVENDTRPEDSPWFNLTDLKLSRDYKNYNFYIGAQNIFNFYPEEDIIHNAANPFSDTFDASYSYAPMLKTRFFAGLNVTLN